MEWIRISQNKLKIMLTAEDARHYELNCEEADYTDMVTRTAFREILTDVKREADFDASEDKVYIQMYPSKEGGCELFVTKVGLLLTEDTGACTPTVLPRKKERPRRTAELRIALRFEDKGDALLISVCGDCDCGSSVIEEDEAGVVRCILESLVDGVDVRMHENGIGALELRVALEQ